MTTVAWDGQQLVADRQINCGNGKGSCTKIFRLRDGRLFGATGEHQDALLVRDWLNGNEGRPSNVGEGFVALVVTLGGGVFRLENKLVLAPVEEGFCAIGSGSDYATAAMALGKGARVAVAIAGRFDPYTGTATDVLRIAKPRRK